MWAAVEYANVASAESSEARVLTWVMSLAPDGYGVFFLSYLRVSELRTCVPAFPQSAAS